MATESYKDLNSQTKTLMGRFSRSQGGVMKGFQSLHQAGMEAGALDAKTKELMALAISIAKQCDRCIGLHVASAIQHGATRGEIEETVSVAVVMGGGPSMMYGMHALAAVDELSA